MISQFIVISGAALFLNYLLMNILCTTKALHYYNKVNKRKKTKEKNIKSMHNW